MSDGGWSPGSGMWATSSSPSVFERVRSQPAELARAVRYYVLNEEGMPIIETDSKAWAAWMAHSEQRHLKRTDLPDGTSVSTDFIGASFELLAPDVWETGVRLNGERAWTKVQTYATADAASAGHDIIVTHVRGGRAIRLREG